jgi:uncharacterized protein YbaR (Trm112 family)
MNINESLVCPKCNGTEFTVKREATYLYSYKLNTPISRELSDNEEALPFLFDNREQICDNEYLQCEKCGAQYPCDLEGAREKVHLTILQKAIRSYFENNPNFLG